jgi:hypothetical protein
MSDYSEQRNVQSYLDKQELKKASTKERRCTRNMSDVQWTEGGLVDTREINKHWPTEERIDTIGTNGNDGEHYMKKYDRKMRDGTVLDVYDVLDAFDVSNPATAHAIKKLLCTGSRGAKDWETDLQEAIDSLERAKAFPPVPF